MSQSTLSPAPPRPLDIRAPEAGGVIVDATRPRQTEPPAAPFRDFLAGGVSVLMGGAAVATHVMGAPRLAAAISGAESRATTAISGPAALPSRDFVPGGGAGAATPLPGGAGGVPAAGAAAIAAPGGADGSDLAQMQAMQRESQMFNMQLLALQDQVQQDSQRFTTLSNVMRAKHDTAKAAVSNIRS
jgi:hypothetical protein